MSKEKVLQSKLNTIEEDITGKEEREKVFENLIKKKSLKGSEYLWK